MMKRIAVLFLVLTLALAPAPRVQAQDGGYPQTVSTANPYGTALETAKKAYDDAMVAYRAAAPLAYRSWSHYNAYVQAYYLVWNTWTRYQWYLRAYWWAESASRFSGNVVESGIRMAVKDATVKVWTYVGPYERRATQLVGTAITDYRGAFKVGGLAAAKYTYTVEKAGFETYRRDIEVTARGASAYVSLDRLVAVKGQVLNGERPVAGVKVSLYRTDVVYIRAPDANAVVYTDLAGRFAIPRADYATARLIFEKTNYATATRDLKSADLPADLTVKLDWNGPFTTQDATFDDLNRR